MPQSALDRTLRRQEWMERWSDAIQGAVGGFYGALGPAGRGLKDVMHGTKLLGHPLHPALTDMPLGLWTFGVVADLAAIAGRMPGWVGSFALLLGFVAALGAAATGYTDFHETYGLERRTALTHGLTMTAVVGLDAVSLLLRWLGGAGGHGAGVGLAVVALLLAFAGMYVGGHVTFGFGTMIDHNAFAAGPEEAVEVGASGDFPDGQMKRVMAGEMPVLMTRLEGVLYAIASTCSHAGGPLDEGELSGDTVSCPWHGSCFSVRDGSVRHGPATFPQPRLLVEEKAGRVAVRLAEPLH